MRFLAAILFVLAGVSGPAAQDVLLSGNTYRMNGPQYQGLPNVSIVVTRGNSVIKEGKSGADGRFTLKVPAGAPFTVAFYGEQRVPELQQLAGLETTDRFTENNVNITMLTPSEYQKERGKFVPLDQKLACDLAMLPPEAKAARDYIQSMRASAGRAQ